MRIELSEQEAIDIVKTIQDWIEYTVDAPHSTALTDRTVRLAELCVRLSELYPDAIRMVVVDDD